MRALVAGLGVAVVALVLLEAFEALLLPRRIAHPLRIARTFTAGFWRLWKRLAHLVPRSGRDDFLAVYAPLSLLLLFALWACLIVGAFATIHAARGSWVQAPEGRPDWGTYLYLSATTFITLGFGDVAPRSPEARLLTDVEAGIGFGYLAIVIGYLPVLYGAFARREVEIGLLDARASTPPSAGEFLRRLASDPDHADLEQTLRDWERWSAELLESHLSYPTLIYYRSQHDRQSWLATLTTILDVSAVWVAAAPAGTPPRLLRQARLTFAMARHAAVDLRLLCPVAPRDPERLDAAGQESLRVLLADAGLVLAATEDAHAQWSAIRALYEPHVGALSRWLDLPLPSWPPDPQARDHWHTSGDPRDHFFRIGAPPRS